MFDRFKERHAGKIFCRCAIAYSIKMIVIDPFGVRIIKKPEALGVSGNYFTQYLGFLHIYNCIKRGLKVPFIMYYDRFIKE